MALKLRKLSYALGAEVCDIDVSAPSAVRGTLTVTQANQTLADAGTVTVEPPLAADSLELFVYRDMKAHRSELGDRGYTRKLHERALIVHPLGPGEEQDEEEGRLKTIRNYVSTYRHELAPDTVQRRHRKASKPAPESLQKLPKNFSRNFPKLPKPPGKSCTTAVNKVQSVRPSTASADEVLPVERVRLHWNEGAAD